ncbi:hypothetical protein FB451DRAFT_1557827 [Mycena latifolia]|nr:hypothetical protein FB451DRAFT_1557827 [Mycena latifolia]
MALPVVIHSAIDFLASYTPTPHPGEEDWVLTVALLLICAINGWFMLALAVNRGLTMLRGFLFKTVYHKARQHDQPRDREDCRAHDKHLPAARHRLLRVQSTRRSCRRRARHWGLLPAQETSIALYTLYSSIKFFFFDLNIV